MENSLEKIGKATSLTTEEVSVLKNTVAKNTTDTELSYFIMNAQQMGLNPFAKEIWCYKDNKGNLLVFAGRDGFLKKAQQDPRWNGMKSSEVRENDEFAIDFWGEEITHKINPKDRGEIVGAYCYIKPKDVESATIEWVDFKTYNRGFSVWKSNPADMIKKTAEAKALKKAFGISGLASEYEFAVKDNAVQPLPETPEVDKEKERIKGFIEKASTPEQLEEVEPFLDEETKDIYEQKKLEL